MPLTLSMSLLDTSVNGCTGTMGLSWGLQPATLTPKQTNRWLFGVPDYITGNAPALPPRKGARPSISMRETEFQHLSESVWFPLKGDWKPINLTLYDIRCNQNAIFNWLQTIYDPSQGSSISFGFSLPYKVPTCTLELYDGCGNVMETWYYQNAYPSNIEWGELTMDSADIVMVNLTLRYDRAYFVTA